MMRSFIGDKAFYRRVLVLMLPIMIQNGITNFVNMLDNVMVGSIGTNEMTGVVVTNHLIFVFNLCIFGVVSGAGIFGAQYFGCGDHNGVQHAFRFKLLSGMFITLLTTAILLFSGDKLILLYLQGEGDAAAAQASLDFAQSYLRIMLIGLIPYTIVQCYSSTLRECGQATPPMCAGVIAVLVNLVLNYILIFGHFGAPKLGVVGAAVATVISRYVELIIVAVWTRKNADKTPFIRGAYRSFYVPQKLISRILAKGFPLMLNETLWASGMATLNQCYSVHSLDMVAASNISSTFFNVFGVAFMSVGVAIGIILGQELGANETDQAREDCRKLIFFSFVLSILVSIIYALATKGIPYIYNTTPEVRHLATRLMQISALAMPLDALAHASYFTLRSGGKVLITFLFDSGFVWGLCVVIAYALTAFTSLSVLWIFFIIQMLNLVKATLGILLVKRGVWIKNIVE